MEREAIYIYIFSKYRGLLLTCQCRPFLCRGLFLSCRDHDNWSTLLFFFFSSSSSSSCVHLASNVATRFNAEQDGIACGPTSIALWGLPGEMSSGPVWVLEFHPHRHLECYGSRRRQLEMEATKQHPSCRVHTYTRCGVGGYLHTLLHTLAGMRCLQLRRRLRQ